MDGILPEVVMPELHLLAKALSINASKNTIDLSPLNPEHDPTGSAYDKAPGVHEYVHLFTGNPFMNWLTNYFKHPDQVTRLFSRNEISDRAMGAGITEDIQQVLEARYITIVGDWYEWRPINESGDTKYYLAHIDPTKGCD